MKNKQPTDSDATDDGAKGRRNFTMDDETHQRLQSLAKKKKTSMSGLLTAWINEEYEAMLDREAARSAAQARLDRSSDNDDKRQANG